MALVERLACEGRGEGGEEWVRGGGGGGSDVGGRIEGMALVVRRERFDADYGPC